MGFARVYNLVRNWLWEAGGIGAALDLGLDALGSAGYEPCPCEVAANRTATRESALCQPCSISFRSTSARPQSR